MVLLRELGRTEFGLPALRDALTRTSWRFLPLDLDQVDEFAALGGIRDPFERLIVAAARSTGAKLISGDAQLAGAGLVDA